MSTESEAEPVEVNVEHHPVSEQHEKDARMWAMILHLSALAAYVTGIGLFAPILVWQIKKNEYPELDAHGKMATNWLISLLIYMTVAGVLALAIIGFFLIPILIVLSVIFPIIAGVKANNGELWNYPLTIKFIK